MKDTFKSGMAYSYEIVFLVIKIFDFLEKYIDFRFNNNMGKACD